MTDLYGLARKGSSINYVIADMGGGGGGGGGVSTVARIVWGTFKRRIFQVQMAICLILGGV